MSLIISRQLQNFYKVSPMREGILNWYPFASDSAVLEQSDGALTRLLLEKCESVTSFGKEYDGSGLFDYVVCIDPEEITTELLIKYRSYLTSHGRLLMAFDNPYGLQYFAGKRNPRTDLIFQWVGESKREIEIRLKQAGFERQKWYYPFTNHYFAREVYSENYLPNEFLNHRDHIFVEDDYSKEFDERELWNEVIRGGAFEFLCNSYLVEACVCNEDEPCDVDFAAITAYREHEKAFITTVHNDGTACKRAVFQEGLERLNILAENHNDLKRLGVNVLPVRIDGGCLKMERINLPTLLDYWTQKLQNGELDECLLFAHFDRIRDAIKASAKEGRSYWELVPANCFYDAEKDELIFFDQEYYWENVDPDMVLVRAINALRYSVEFQKDKKTSSWISALKERYDLTEKWDSLSELAGRKTSEFVFNKVHTKPLDRAVERAKNRAAERNAERAAERIRYKKMCIAVNTLLLMGIQHPAIYGYGLRGKMLRYVLEMVDIDPACIVDKQLPFVCGVPLFDSVDRIPAKNIPDAIIVTPFKGADEIAAELRKKVNCHVMTIEELVNGEN